MDKRERVARAIAMVTDLHPDPLSGLDYERADAAIAALETMTVRTCRKCGAPENNHPYRHPFIAIENPAG